MRITGGILKGRQLLAPKGISTRPTSDRVRESLFNILVHSPWLPNFPDIITLDAFAGTGALGIEALSQGSKFSIFFEIDKGALNIIKENVSKLNLEHQVKTLKQDATTLPQRPNSIPPANLIFIDPPYSKNLGEKALIELSNKDWFDKKALFVLESAKKSPENIPSGFKVLDERIYGDTRIQFLQLEL